MLVAEGKRRAAGLVTRCRIVDALQDWGRAAGHVLQHDFESRPPPFGWLQGLYGTGNPPAVPLSRLRQWPLADLTQRAGATVGWRLARMCVERLCGGPGNHFDTLGPPG